MDNVGPILSMARDGAGALYSPQVRALFHTSDFGRKWEPVENPGMYLADMAIGISGFGAATSYRGLLATPDFGRSWTPVAVDAMPLSVAVQGPFATVACAGGVLFVTSDRGEEWRRVDVGVNGVPAGVQYATDGRCYVLFTAIIPDTASSVDAIRLKAYEAWERRQRYSPADRGPFNSADEMSDWVVAQRLLSTRTALVGSGDGWRTWKAEAAAEPLRPVTFGASEDTIVLIGYDGGVACRTAERPAWDAKSRLPRAPWAVWVVSDDVWLCPDDYNILRTADAGITWTKISPKLNLISGTCFVTEQRGFTTSGNYNGTFTVAETTDAGKTWQTILDYPSR